MKDDELTVRVCPEHCCWYVAFADKLFLRERLTEWRPLNKTEMTCRKVSSTDEGFKRVIAADFKKWYDLRNGKSLPEFIIENEVLPAIKACKALLEQEAILEAVDELTKAETALETAYADAKIAH